MPTAPAGAALLKPVPAGPVPRTGPRSSAGRHGINFHVLRNGIRIFSTFRPGQFLPLVFRLGPGRDACLRGCEEPASSPMRPATAWRGGRSKYSRTPPMLSCAAYYLPTHRGPARPRNAQATCGPEQVVTPGSASARLKALAARPYPSHMAPFTTGKDSRLQ